MALGAERRTYWKVRRSGKGALSQTTGTLAPRRYGGCGLRPRDAQAATMPREAAEQRATKPQFKGHFRRFTQVTDQPCSAFGTLRCRRVRIPPSRLLRACPRVLGHSCRALHEANPAVAAGSGGGPDHVGSGDDRSGPGVRSRTAHEPGPAVVHVGPARGGPARRPRDLCPSLRTAAGRHPGVPARVRVHACPSGSRTVREESWPSATRTAEGWPAPGSSRADW